VGEGRSGSKVGIGAWVCHITCRVFCFTRKRNRATLAASTSFSISSVLNARSSEALAFLAIATTGHLLMTAGALAAGRFRGDTAMNELLELPMSRRVDIIVTRLTEGLLQLQPATRSS
jgi:hypothetical protein